MSHLTQQKIWSRRHEAWFRRLRRCRQPKTEQIDLKWCLEANELVDFSLREHKEISDAVKLGEFIPTTEQLEVTNLGIRKTKQIWQCYQEICKRIIKDKKHVEEIRQFKLIEEKDKINFLSGAIIEKRSALKIISHLHALENKVAGNKSQGRNEVGKPSKPKNSRGYRPVRPTTFKSSAREEPIWWAEPEPVPKARDRLEVTREQLATLSERVAQQKWQDAFGRRSMQPRSDFRRFRN